MNQYRLGIVSAITNYYKNHIVRCSNELLQPTKQGVFILLFTCNFYIAAKVCSIFLYCIYIFYEDNQLSSLEVFHFGFCTSDSIKLLNTLFFNKQQNKNMLPLKWPLDLV